MGDALHWDATALRSQLAPSWPGIEIEIVPETGSTNSDLLNRVRARGTTDAVAPSLRVAEQQLDGRGRMGRAWLSSRGRSLTFSLAVPLAAVDWSGLSLAVGVAVADALDAGARIGLKWPNDLWLRDDSPACGRKLGGVLIETVASGAERIAVVGVGINLRHPGPPIEVATGYACLAEIGVDASAPAVLHQVAPALGVALRTFEREGFAAFGARFAARDLLRGRAVRTTQADAPDGIADGVTAQGALVVRRGAGHVLVSSGEVSVRLDGAAATAARVEPC